ncbi:MAG: hypothetical protein ACLFQA_00690 [Bacteroidales bacterium]
MPFFVPKTRVPSRLLTAARLNTADGNPSDSLNNRQSPDTEQNRINPLSVPIHIPIWLSPAIVMIIFEDIDKVSPSTA